MTHPKDGEGAEALLPCPFCGGAVKTKVRGAELHESPMTGKVWSITCFGGETNAHAWMYDDREDRVIAAWNRRAPPATPVRGGGGEGSSVSQRQPCGEASADAEVFAGLAAEPAAAWVLNAEQSEAFATALTEAATPNAALLEAATRYRASHGMTVAELRTLLNGQPDDARVLVFDHFYPDRTTTIGANCILSTDHNGPVAIICNQEEGA